MSTNNKLTAEQKAAANFAIDMYALKQMKLNGGIKAKPVILLPEFEMDTDGDFVPKQSTGIRPTKKDGFMYIRLAMPYVAISSTGVPEIKVMKTNVFNADTKLEMLLEAYDMTIGSALPDTVLVTEETLTTPGVNTTGQFKGGWQVKYAGADSNMVCTFTGELNGVTYDTPAPIYRRVKLAPTGSTNTLIQHTNGADISKFASAAWTKLNNPAAGILNLKSGAAEIASTEARLKELKAIKAALRTPEQKAEIAELTEALEELTSK
jgi:hypothetical protein